MPERITILEHKRIILAVTGSIACYKAVDLASKLTQAGAQVDVILTEAAQKFVLPLTFQAVTGRAVYTDMWATDTSGGLPTHIAHVALGEGADGMLVAPATANTLAKLAGGVADDLLSVTALAARSPLLVAPAMDGGMYAHPATTANVATLRARSVTVIEPDEGRFASGLVGRGRLPDTPTLVGALRQMLGRGGGLAGRQVIVTAGGTREAIDPVRFITNRSSGKQGYALAQAALDAGAAVTLISAATGLPTPYGAHLVAVDSAEAMHDAVLSHIDAADVLMMAAAVADFRPARRAEQKIKKATDSNDAPVLELARTPDILLAVRDHLKATGQHRVIVGFAAESENLHANARDKLQRKGVNLLVANDISAGDAGFEVDTNRVTIFDDAGGEDVIALSSKTRISEAIVARVAARLG